MMEERTPQQVVEELDKHIVGQTAAKRAAAIAIRNRWRRRQLPDGIREEIGPSNMILIGRTGVGKTEIARRLAGLVNAPFVKVEATKYTEVGYHGRDVESMVRDLVELAVHLVHDEQTQVVREEAERQAEEALLDVLMPQQDGAPAAPVDPDAEERRRRSREKLRSQLHAGDLNDRMVELTIDTKPPASGFMATFGMDQLDPNTQNFLESILPSQPKRRSMTVSAARRILFDQACDKLIDREKVTETAIKRTENGGIIFLDEIDKLASPSKSHGGPDVSRQGVQRDLLPIIEGCTVTTRHGPVKTDHILVIAAGAFHDCKPSDLMPELQGRLPIRVELDDLTEQDFVRILTEPENALTKQQVALLAVEGVLIEFTNDAVEAMAAIAFRLNQSAGNIGARRLTTVMERVMEDISFDAPSRSGKTIRIDRPYVEERIAELSADTDLSRFIL